MHTYELGDLVLGVTAFAKKVVMGGHSPTPEEILLHFILLLSAILAMASFFLTSSYSTMLWIYVVGVVGGVVITVPDYAFFNRCPRSWLSPLENEVQAMARKNRAHAHSGGGRRYVQ